MPVQSTVVTGIDSPVGRRLMVDPGVRPTPDRAADAVVDLAWPEPDPDRTRAVLAHADGVRTLVYVSSAVVYGAWPDNPVPLTEDAPIRPNPGVSEAARHAEAERIIGDWAAVHPRAAVTILRPAAMLGPGVETWLSRTLTAPPRLRSESTDPPRQFVHVDDVAAAIRLALLHPLEGVFNVAADGAVAAEEVRRLSASRVSVPVPDPVAQMATRWSHAAGLSPVGPELLPVIEFPLVLANDRLRAAGWAPQFTNEEAVVAGRPGSWWREMSPSRRQQLTLGGSAAVLAAGAIATVAAVRRVRRRVASP
jgi:nucleoside-diphosphate-sugar epimerase